MLQSALSIVGLAFILLQVGLQVGGVVKNTALATALYSIGGLLLLLGIGLAIYSAWTKKREVVLRFNGEVKNLDRVNKNEVAMHRGRLPTAEGNVRVLIRAVFNPVAPSLPIQNMKLDVSGIELETAFPPTEVSKGSTWEGSFEIPEELGVRNMTASLVAYVGTERFLSREFPIPFDKLGE